MVPRFPVVSSKQLIKFFEERGFHKDRQKGSHIMLEKEGVARTIVIPERKEVDIDIVQGNLRTAGISKDEFIAAMRRAKK